MIRTWVILTLFALISLLAVSASACTTPTDGMLVTSSTTLCNGVYFFDQGITVRGNDIVLDCQGSVIQHALHTTLVQDSNRLPPQNYSGDGVGLLVDSSNNVSITDCSINMFETGFAVVNSSNVELMDNRLVRNKIGTRLISSTNVSTLNSDISLEDPYQVVDSVHNALSLSNKHVDDESCKDNVCNLPRDAFVAFLPIFKHSAPQNFLDWIMKGVTV